MKKLSITLLTLLLIVSGIAYINLTIFKASISGVGSLFGGHEYIETLNKITTFEPIYEVVPVEYREAVEGVVDKISKDKQIQDIISKETSNTLDDVINGSNSFNQDKLTNDLFDVFDDYAEDIEAATNKTVPKELIRVEFEKRIAGYDLNTKYEQVIQKVQTKLTDKQRSFLNFTKGFVDYVDTYIMISMFGVIVSTILIAILSLKALLPVSIVGLLLVLVNKLTLPLVLPKLMEKVAGQIVELSLDTKVFNIAFIYLGVLLTIGVVGRFLYHKQGND